MTLLSTSQSIFFAVLILIALLISNVSAQTLPAGSSISWEQIQASAETWGQESDDVDSSGDRRRLLHLEDYYYEQCVYWINVVRAKEGLPALQRWKDFEPCADRGVRYDAKNNVYHGAITKGLYCDWENYFPISQNACPKWHSGTDANESCTKAMWEEKALLKSKTVDNEEVMQCKNGKEPNQCAGHYFNLRGGEHGYNSFDRVACGFYAVGNEIWINQNYGSAKKTRVEDLKTADNWKQAPENWLPENYQRYGFACGGDEDIMPPKLLVDDCDDGHFHEMRYDGCADSYRHDYRWHACVDPTCDSSYDGPCEDLTVTSDGSTLLLDGTGEDVCSSLDLVAPCADPHSFEFPKNSKKYMKTSIVCRKSCQTCGCPTKPFEIGFSPTVKPTNAPETPIPTAEPTTTPEPSIATTPEPSIATTPEPSVAITSEPSSAPVLTAEPTKPVRCNKYKAKGKCRDAFGCSWGRRGPCEPLTETCDELNKIICKNSYGCTWQQKPKKDRGCKITAEEEQTASD